MVNIYEKIGLTKLIEDNILIIPKNISNIKLDIGLSYCAPNSQLWLRTLKDRIIFAFEPLPSNINSINHLGLTNDPNFKLLYTALDNIIEPTYTDFYVTNTDPGCSSLYKPTKYLPYTVKEVIKVPVISLEYFLSLIPWKRFKYIEHIKIDTQGKDYNILQSISEYLHKIVFINVETTVFNHYEKDDDNYKINDLLVSNNFECIKENKTYTHGWNGIQSNEIVDKQYINKKYKHLKEILDSRTV
ncbi:MAG: FkbM family methyltransferase [Candidatus Omnitrophica bacterium]|jgi:FkbM family methyltransferase|nr:FkbM family methyltransferase [Candidatus Omnitrophota bacterium]